MNIFAGFSNIRLFSCILQNQVHDFIFLINPMRNMIETLCFGAISLLDILIPTSDFTFKQM